jgi:hypothetical protein
MAKSNRSLYPVISGCNDQNVLALHFFEAGYHLWSMVVASGQGNHEKCMASVEGFKSYLNAIQAYAKINTPAWLTADLARQELEGILQSHSDLLLPAGKIKMLCRKVKSSVNIDKHKPVDIACRWLIVGMETAALDLIVEAKASRNEINKQKLQLTQAWNNVITQADSRNNIRLGKTSPSFVDTKHVRQWLKVNAQAIWEPAICKEEKHRFNGRVLSDAEFTIMVTLRKYACGSTAMGLTVVELQKKSGVPSARNCLPKLRKYPETRGFISPGPPLRFIGEAPEPPENY